MRTASLTVDVATRASSLEFMDSSGIAALLRIRELASAADVPFAITEASAPVQRVVAVTGLEDILFPPA